MIIEHKIIVEWDILIIISTSPNMTGVPFKSLKCMMQAVDEIEIRSVLILCTKVKCIKTTEYSPSLNNQEKVAWMYCDLEIQSFTSVTLNVITEPRRLL